MNPVHLHLVANHLPVVGLLFLLPVLATVWFKGRDSGVALAAAVLLLLAGGSAFPAYFSGEQAEELVEGSPGITKSYLEAHEDAAKVALPTGGLALLAGAALLISALRGPQVPTGLLLIVTIVSLVAAGLMIQIGSTGGKIVHPEARAGASTADNAVPGSSARSGRKAWDDD